MGLTLVPRESIGPHSPGSWQRKVDRQPEPLEVEVWKSAEVRWVDGQHSRHLLGLELIRLDEVIGHDEDDAALTEARRSQPKSCATDLSCDRWLHDDDQPP